MSGQDWHLGSPCDGETNRRWLAASRRLASGSKLGASRVLASSSGRTRSDNASDRDADYVELPPARRRAIMAGVHDSVQSVLASMLQGDDRSGTGGGGAATVWRPKMRKKGISYYEDQSDVGPGRTRFCCVSRTSASVRDVLQLFLLADTEALLRNNRVLYDNVLEARVLSVLRRPSAERPMHCMYVRYSCFQTPAPLANRDMCVAVATDVLAQPDGSTVGYCLWDSVHDPAFAHAASTRGLQPCAMFRSGFFLHRDARGGDTKVVYLVGLEPGGWAPGLQVRLVMERFGANLARLCSHFRRRHLDASGFVLQTQWAPKAGARSCRRCRTRFQLLAKRVNCHACGHVVCKACCSKETVELHAVGLVPMNICHACLERLGLAVAASPRLSAVALTLERQRSDASGRSHSSARSLQSQPTLETSSGQDEDDEDEDEEWSFTPDGVPVRPYRVAS